MIKKNLSFAKDDIDRLQGIAFWLWEYQRRNKQYIHFCNVIEYYLGYFDSIDVADYMNSEEFHNEMFSYLYSHEDGGNFFEQPFVKRLGEEHGEIAQKMFYKFSNLGEAFRKKFFRIYKHYSVGIDTDKIVEKKLLCEKNEETVNKILSSFRSKNLEDISALLNFNQKWSIAIDGNVPDWYNVEIEKSDLVSIDPTSFKEGAFSIDQELNAIKLMNATLRNLFTKKTIQNEVLDFVYALCIKSSNIIPADFTRLQLLWIFDNARQDGYEDPLPFNEVYKKLSGKVSESDHSEELWSQFSNKEYRLKQYYDRLCIKIDTMNPLRFKKNNPKTPTLKEIFAL